MLKQIAFLLLNIAPMSVFAQKFPPPCPFILRSARNVDAPMYLAARQTQ